MAERIKPRRRAAILVVAVVILAAAGGVGSAWVYGGVAPQDLPQRALALWRAWRTPPSDLVLQGNVEVRQVNLGFKVAGRIEKLAVDEGDAVRPGEKLASLEKVYFTDALAEARALRDQAAANDLKMRTGNRLEDIAQAEANVEEAQATLKNANQTFDRAEALLRAASGTVKDRDDALAAQRVAVARVDVAQQALNLMKAGYRAEDIAAAQAQLAQQDAAVAVAERQLDDADLVAPSAGVVQSRVREAGAIVNVGDPVFVLSLTTPVWVRAYVDEPDLPRLKPGMAVVARTDNPAVGALKGRVGFISTVAEFTPKTVETRELRTALVYRLRVVVDDPDNALRQGMPVTLDVVDAAPAANVAAAR
jgi:HlyD family secretion protein